MELNVHDLRFCLLIDANDFPVVVAAQLRERLRLVCIQRHKLMRFFAWHDHGKISSISPFVHTL